MLVPSFLPEVLAFYTQGIFLIQKSFNQENSLSLQSELVAARNKCTTLGTIYLACGMQYMDLW